MKLLIVFLFIISHGIYAKGRIYSLGAGLWNPSTQNLGFNGKKTFSDFSESRFARLSHEGLISNKLLYVASIGLNISNTKTQFSYDGDTTKTELADIDAQISMLELRVGMKYNLGQNFYFGGGILLGDFQISFDRSDYVEATGNTDLENFTKSENQNYLGHYGEAGLMFASKNFGTRLGTEFNSATVQKGLDTLGEKQPTLISSKLYIEILWKN